MINLGRDVWGNAPSASSPVDDLFPWLDEMRSTAEGWKEGVKAGESKWFGKIDALAGRINAFEAEITGDVFLSKTNVAVYNSLTGDYQSLKDTLTLSSDFYLSQFQQDLANSETALGKAGDLFERLLTQAKALLRQLFGGAGVVIGGAIVLVVVYLYVTGRRK